MFCELWRMTDLIDRNSSNFQMCFLWKFLSWHNSAGGSFQTSWDFTLYRSIAFMKRFERIPWIFLGPFLHIAPTFSALYPSVLAAILLSNPNLCLLNFTSYWGLCGRFLMLQSGNCLQADSESKHGFYPPLLLLRGHNPVLFVIQSLKMLFIFYLDFVYVESVISVAVACS